MRKRRRRENNTNEEEKEGEKQYKKSNKLGTSTGFEMSTEKKKHLMKIHFQHTFIQGIFTK